MHQLLDAIITKFNATAALTTTITGGIHTEAAKDVNDPASTPILIISPVAYQTDQSYGTAISGPVSIRFTVYGGGARAVGVLAKAVTDAYDNTLLSLTGASNNGVRRTMGPLLRLQPEADPVRRSSTATEIYAAHVIYEYFVEGV